MRIAVTYDNGQIFQHFGHTEYFKVYNVENGQIAELGVFPTNGSGHGALASLLDQQGIKVLICGGLGGCARTALHNAGIAVYGGVSGDADEAVELFLSSTLNYNPNACCSHHDHHHGEGHSCGSHCH